MKFKLIVIIVLLIAVTPLAINLFSQAGNVNEEGEIIVSLSMAGFDPPVIRVKAGEEIKIKLVNKDNEFHTDGGGWHQFASDELSINYKIKPEGTEVVTLKVDQPGEYPIYCDICCGGKENPYMQGKIIVS